MPSYVLQAAAIPVRGGKICLVTSRDGKRWVIPKGKIEPKQTPLQAAQAEAWEEAGVTGTISIEPVGHYSYSKSNKKYRVAVYLLQVEDEAVNWPERNDRVRKWVSPEVARDKLKEPELKAIMAKLAELPKPETVEL